MKNEKVVSLLPEYLQTYPQESFLGSTADRVFSKGTTKKINAYIGRKPSYYNNTTDFYKSEISQDRQNFQLEPAAVYNNKVVDYNDFVAHMRTNGTDVSNPHRPLATEVYSWCPYVNISKLDEYMNYFWCPYGASIIKISSQPNTIILTEPGVYLHKIKSVKSQYASPLVKIDGFIVGYTIQQDSIVVDISTDMVGKPMTIIEVANLQESIKKGNIDWDYRQPCHAYTYSNKKTYDLSTNPPTTIISKTKLPEVELYSIERIVNGMVLELEDLTGTTLMEVSVSAGVIELIPYTIPDGTKVTPNYYVIERNAQNRNKWSKNNFWVHKSAIVYSDLSSIIKATHPIVEYSSRIKLFNYGLTKKEDVQYGYSNTHGFAVFDKLSENMPTAKMTLTANVTVEYLNTINHTIWNKGRIVIIDSSPTIENKIYKTILFNSRIAHNLSTLSSKQKEWVEASKLDNPLSKYLFDTFPWDGGTMIDLEDSYPDEPKQYDYVEINNGGYQYDKRELSFDGEQWGYSQEYIDGVEPLFDLFDHNGTSFASKTTYANSNFTGEKIFAYKPGILYDSTIKANVEKNEFRNFIFVDNLSNPFLYNNLKYNKYVAIVDGINFAYTNHWHKKDYSLSERTTNAYEVHSSIHANPFNNNIVEISQNYWLDHFNGLNAQDWNSHSKGINYSLGNKIKQHRNSSLMAMSLVANDIDFLEALKYSEKEYSKFHNKFITKLKDIDETVGLPSITAIDQTFVIDVIRKISATKNDTHPYFDNTVKNLRTFIPNTPAYLGITRLHKPTISSDNNTIHTHDGSIYRKDNKLDPAVSSLIFQCVYQLEQLIYEEAILHGASTEKYSFDFNEIISYPYDQSKEYTYFDFIKAASQFFTRWASAKDIDYHLNTTYDIANEFSYNYSNSTNFLNTKLPGCYRGIYKVLFRTDTPESTPWEILGFNTKPAWWDSVYSWTDNSKRNALITSIKTGLTSNPNSTIKTYSTPISYISSVTPVDLDGNLLSPIAAKIISKSANDKFDFTWSFGDHGPVETAFWKSKESSFALCGTAYVMKPAKLISGSWLCGDEIYRNGQWTKQSNGSREFDKHQNIHGEWIDNTHISKYGVQTIISDYQKSLGKNITTELGNVIRTVETKLIHKLGGFVFDDLSLYSESSGVIPKNNYTTILHTSPPKSEFYYSGVIVEKRESTYAIYGYNPITPSFKSYDVNDHGPAITVSTDPYPVPADWMQQTDYRNGNRAKRGNRVYRCTTNHNSANKFDIKYWNLIKILSKTNTDLKWYYDYTDQPLLNFDYGHEFLDLQQVVNFLSGYQQYLETIGFQFNRVDTSTNNRYDFRFLVESLIDFDNKEISSDTHNQIITLSPGSEHIDFTFEFGFVEQVNTSRNGLYGIIDHYGRSISNKNIEITRTPNNISIKTKNDIGIYGLRLGLKESEHVLILDNTTSFGDILYDSTYDIRQERIRMSCTTVDNWDGTINADGVIIIDGIAKPNFESKATELQNLYTSDMSGNTQISNMIKHTIGYKDRSYLDDLMMNNQNKFEFYQGMIQHKGTPTVHNRLLRSERLVQNKNIKFAEEWAFNIARYGNISSARNLDIKINSADITTNDILVTLTSTNNVLTPQELSALDTDNTSVTLYTNQTNIDSRIKTSIDSSLIPTLTTYQSDEILSAGYVYEDDFDYSVISDSFFNEWYKHVEEEIKTNTTIHIVNPRQFTIDNSSIIDKNLTLIATNTTYPISELAIEQAGVEVIIGNHLIMTGDFIYIDKTAMDDHEYYGIYPVVDVTETSIIISGEDTSHLFVNDKPSVRLLSRTSVKLSPSADNLNLIQTDTLHPVPLTINSTIEGYYLETNQSATTKTTYPHLRYTPLHNQLIYVECGFSKNAFELLPNNKPRWAIFRYNSTNNTFANIGLQQQKLNIDNIIDIQVYRESAKLDTKQQILEDVQLMSDHTVLFNPNTGELPGILDKDIDFISPIDPCDYSDWDYTQQGKYWIDSSKFAYYGTNTRLPYTSDNCKKLQSKIGKLVKGSSIIIYKWTISDTPPILYKGNGTIYNEEYYTAWSNNETISYGFWVKDSLDIPKTKTHSTTIITQYLENMMTSGFSLLVPIHKNGFVITGINKYLNHDSFLRIKLDNGKETQKFSEWILMRSDDKTSIPTDDLWDSLVYSLAGKTISRNTIPSTALHEIDRYGCDYTAGQSWFKNLPKARIHAMQSLNRIFNKNNLLNDRMNISSLYTTDITEKLEWTKKGNYAIKYHPSPKLYVSGPIGNFADVAAFNASKVLIAQDDHWRVVEAMTGRLSPLYFKTITNISEITIANVNTNILLVEPNKLPVVIKPVYTYPDKYWIDPSLTITTVYSPEIITKNVVKVVDWYKDGYNKSMAPIFIDANIFPTVWSELGKPSFVKTIVNDKWIWIENKTTHWEVVAAESGTFNVHDWNSPEVDNSLNIGTILGLIRDNVLTNEELNTFFFDMITYVLSEQNSVHWFFKTSYMHISGYSASMEKTPVRTKDAIESLIEYINEVKPYRVKVRDYSSIYDTYCGNFKIKVANETVSNKEYKALRSPYDKLPFDVFYWNTNANIDWYVKTPDNKVYWVMYANSDGNYITQDINGNFVTFTKNELDSFIQVNDYDYPFVDSYLPEVFYKTYGIGLKSRLYRRVLRNQVSNALQNQITTSGITFT